ncbi:MAG TPA: hypothetical protein VJ672_10480 [Gemmatimonadaceae bacterium]|nr:hypothetical protein [Gemmatimonadaceae bacterium]
MQGRGSEREVLVIPRDAVIGALMSELLRFAGYRPVFLGVDESPARGVARIGAPIVFVDCDHPSAFSAELKQTLADTGSRLMLYSGARSELDLMQTARRHGADAFALPNGPRALQRAIDAVFGRTETPGTPQPSTIPTKSQPPTATGRH